LEVGPGFRRAGEGQQPFTAERDATIPIARPANEWSAKKSMQGAS